jgi:hypothetical protein
MARRLSITEILVRANRRALLLGTLLGYALALLPVPVFGFLVLGAAGAYLTYQIVRYAMES